MIFKAVQFPLDTDPSNLCKLSSMVPIRDTNRELVLIAKKDLQAQN